MPLEEGIRGIIIFGFILVLLIVGVSIFVLMIKRKNMGLLWFMLQLLMLALCLYYFIRLVDNAPLMSTSMLSEENSLMVGFLGIAWALSMVFMTIGIFASLKNKTK